MNLRNEDLHWLSGKRTFIDGGVYMRFNGVFDIQEFYPPIMEDLLKQAILFAQNAVIIPPKSINVIFHSRKSLLYHNNDPWVKKDKSVEFDVTMGSYDDVEVCEIVGLFMLDKLSKLFEKISVGIYRDDGLSIFKNYNGHQSDKVRKDLTKLIFFSPS